MDSHQTGCVNRYQLFAIFRENLLNEDENLAIIDAKFEENYTIFDQKRFVVYYFDYVG